VVSILFFVPPVILVSVPKHFNFSTSSVELSGVYIQIVPGGKVSILWGHSIDHSKHKICVCTCVLFQTVSEVKLFNCTIPKLLIRKRYYVKGKNYLCNRPWRPIKILRTISNLFLKWQSWYSLPSIIQFRKFHYQHQCTLQLVWGHGALLVWVHFDVRLCGR
jgi:hypothetical protein